MLEIIIAGLIGVLLGAFIMTIIYERMDNDAFGDGYELGREHGKAEAHDSIIKKLDCYIANMKENNNEKDC